MRPTQASIAGWCALLLLVVGAGAQARVDRLSERGSRVDRFGATLPPVLLSFMPAGGAGVVEGVNDMCPWLLAGGHFVGGYSCLNGDGGNYASAGWLVSAAGAPAFGGWSICGNGPNCQDKQGVRLGTGNHFRSNSAVPRAIISTSGCAGFIVDTTVPAAQELVYLEDTSFALRVSGSSVNAYGGDSTGVATVSGASVVAGALHVACGTYQAVANGTSVVRVYLDGVERGSMSTAPLLASANTNLMFGSRSWAGSNFLNGRLFFAFKTDKLLSASEVAAISNAFLGTLTGTKGEALTLTRNTPTTCCRDDMSACTTLPPGRACVANARLKVRPVVPNLLAQSAAFNSSPWTLNSVTIAAPVVTADAAVAPDGTMTADRVDFAAATGGNQMSTLRQAFTIPDTRSIPIFAKAVSGSATFYLLTTGGSANASAACTVTDADWTRCELTQSGTGNTTLDIGISTLSNPSGPGGAQPAASVYLWGAQATSGAVRLDYCPTGAAPASCAAETYTLPTPSRLSQTEGCARMCVAPAWTGSAPATTHILVTSAASASRFLYANGSSDTFGIWDGVAAGLSVAAGSTSGTQRCWVTEWSAAGNFLRLTREDTGGTASKVFTGFPAFNATVGGFSGSVYGVSSLKIGNAPGVCTP